MENLITRIFCLLLIFAFNVDIASAQQPGKRGGNAANFFATDAFGGQNAHLQSGAFGDLFNGSRWISTGQPFVPSGTELYGMRIQDREYQGALSWNAFNGNNAEKNFEITWGITEPIATTIKPSLNFNFAESAFDSETRMTLTAGGTLGIGTANPNQSFRLFVEGPAFSTVGWFQPSDSRYKKGVTTISNASEKLAQLEGVSYDFKKETINGMDFTQLEEKPHLGFIAQDLEKVFPELIMKDKQGYYAVNYQGLIPVLVEGFNDQQEVMEEQENVIENLTNKVDKLESQLQEILTALAESDSPASLRLRPKASKDNSSLQQNRPNPFKGITTIDYELPENATNAKLVIVNIDGQQIKSFNVADRIGNVEFDGSNLAAGTYFYSLIVDGKNLAQQKMIVQ